MGASQRRCYQWSSSRQEQVKLVSHSTLYIPPWPWSATRIKMVHDRPSRSKIGALGIKCFDLAQKWSFLSKFPQSWVSWNVTCNLHNKMRNVSTVVFPAYSGCLLFESHIHRLLHSPETWMDSVGFLDKSSYISNLFPEINEGDHDISWQSFFSHISFPTQIDAETFRSIASKLLKGSAAHWRLPWRLPFQGRYLGEFHGDPENSSMIKHHFMTFMYRLL